MAPKASTVQSLMSLTSVLASFAATRCYIRKPQYSNFFGHNIFKKHKTLFHFIQPDLNKAGKPRRAAEWFPCYSSVLPTSRVFISGYIKWKSVLYFLSPSQTDSQVVASQRKWVAKRNASPKLASTCESVWPGL